MVLQIIASGAQGLFLTLSNSNLPFFMFLFATEGITAGTQISIHSKFSPRSLTLYNSRSMLSFYSQSHPFPNFLKTYSCEVKIPDQQ